MSRKINYDKNLHLIEGFDPHGVDRDVPLHIIYSSDILISILQPIRDKDEQDGRALRHVIDRVFCIIIFTQPFPQRTLLIIPTESGCQNSKNFTIP